MKYTILWKKGNEIFLKICKANLFNISEIEKNKFEIEFEDSKEDDFLGILASEMSYLNYKNVFAKQLSKFEKSNVEKNEIIEISQGISFSPNYYSFTTLILLKEYFKKNPEKYLNVDSFILFNMNTMKKEVIDAMKEASEIAILEANSDGIEDIDNYFENLETEEDNISEKSTDDIHLNNASYSNAFLSIKSKILETGINYDLVKTVDVYNVGSKMLIKNQAGEIIDTSFILNNLKVRIEFDKNFSIEFLEGILILMFVICIFNLESITLHQIPDNICTLLFENIKEYHSNKERNYIVEICKGCSFCK